MVFINIYRLYNRHSDRHVPNKNQHLQTSMNEEFRVINKAFIIHFLESLESRFNCEAKQLIESICILSLR